MCSMISLERLRSMRYRPRLQRHHQLKQVGERRATLSSLDIKFPDPKLASDEVPLAIDLALLCCTITRIASEAFPANSQAHDTC